jgi:hypothetical protein
MQPYRGILFTSTAIVALVVVASIAVLTAGGPRDFPAGSPEAALTDYLAAWDDGDFETAYGFFSDRVQARTSLDSYLDEAEQYRMYGGMPEVARRVTIDDITGTGDRRVVELTVEEIYGEGIGASVFRSPRSIRMVLEDDGWKIDDRLIWLDPGMMFEPM